MRRTVILLIVNKDNMVFNIENNVIKPYFFDVIQKSDDIVLKADTLHDKIKMNIPFTIDKCVLSDKEIHIYDDYLFRVMFGFVEDESVFDSIDNIHRMPIKNYVDLLERHKEEVFFGSVARIIRENVPALNVIN